MRESESPHRWHHKILRTRNGRETEESRSWNMKRLKLLSLVGVTSIALANAGWAAGHGGGGGGFGGGGFWGGGCGPTRGGGGRAKCGGRYLGGWDSRILGWSVEWKKSAMWATHGLKLE